MEQHHSDFQDLDGRLLEQADAVPSRAVQGPDSAEAETSAADISAPAARLDGGRDQWREYAIEAAEQEDEVEKIAEALQEADQPAPPVPLSMVPASVTEPATETTEDTQPA